MKDENHALSNTKRSNIELSKQYKTKLKAYEIYLCYATQ